MDEHTKSLIETAWRDGWEHGSHCSNVGFEDWFQETFSRELARTERKRLRRLTQEKPDAQ